MCSFYSIRSAEAGQAWVVNGPESDQPEVKVIASELSLEAMC